MTPTIYSDVILWERSLQFWAEKILSKNDHVLDVGANVGGLTIAFARLVGEAGRVVAIEANPAMCARIELDIAANKINNVTLVHAAAFSESGRVMQLHIDPSFYASASSLVNPHVGTETVDVRTMTIDEICKAQNLSPKLIKLDIEGAEYQALQGAQDTLEKLKPFLIFECTETKGPLFDLLANYGYTIFDANDLRPASTMSVSKHAHNFVALPPQTLPMPALGATEIYRIDMVQKLKMFIKALFKRGKQDCIALDNDVDRNIALDNDVDRDVLIHVNFTYQGSGDGRILVYSPAGVLIMMYQAEFSHLLDPACSVFPLHLLASEAPYQIRVEAVEGASGQTRLDNIKVTEII